MVMNAVTVAHTMLSAHDALESILQACEQTFSKAFCTASQNFRNGLHYAFFLPHFLSV
jgi:hypothetical protein